jgi:hypothetical protein
MQQPARNKYKAKGYQHMHRRRTDPGGVNEPCPEEEAHEPRTQVHVHRVHPTVAVCLTLLRRRSIYTHSGSEEPHF